jgi:hypothetical protein
MEYIKAFVAGFLSTLVFHQGAVALLHVLGLSARGAYVVTPTGPLHVPAVISLAFWGGVWGLPLYAILRRVRGEAQYWLVACGFGAVLPSVVAWFVVLPLKGQPVAGGWQRAVLLVALAVNGAWGLGTALLLRFTRRTPASRSVAPH